MTRTSSLSQQLVLEPEAPQIISALLAHKRKVPKRRRGGSVTIRTAASNLAKIYRAVWAKSTLSRRKNLFLNFNEWLARHQRPLTDHSATLFLESIGTTKQTRHQYGKELMAILNRMQHPTSRLSLYLSGLRALGALVPFRQAKPMPKEVVMKILADGTISYDVKVALMVAWKTASRWGEVYQLTGENFIYRAPQQVIIDWERKTKTTRSDPFRASKYTVIEGDMTAEIYRAVAKLRSGQSLTKCTTKQFGKLLKKRIGGGYGVHSIKHGAMSHLVRLGAEGLVTPDQLELIAKHKKATQLASTTVRYLQDKVATARFLGTQAATRLL
jgi:hypothetical protein